jgi:hypothetical protein
LLYYVALLPCHYYFTLHFHFVAATSSLLCRFVAILSLRLSSFKNHPTGTNLLITFPTTATTTMVAEFEPSRKRAAPAASTTKEAKRSKPSEAGKANEPAQTTNVDM